MALKSSNKVSPNFSMSSMTDIVFLLLIFFMVTSTMIAPNALKLLLPQSNGQTSAKAITTVSIDQNLQHAVEDKRVSFEEVEPLLQEILFESPEPTISLHVDKTIAMEHVVRVMNIAKRNKYKLILATSPER